MKYNFNDIVVNRESRFAIGQELTTEKYYISFPVRNGYVDYDEYYELTPNQFENFMVDQSSILHFLSECRKRKKDHLSIFYPIALNRGFPC